MSVYPQLGTVVQTYPIFLNMDAELRVHFLLLLRPVMIFNEEYLYEALDTCSEAYFLVQGNLETWIYENQVRLSLAAWHVIGFSFLQHGM